MDHTSESIKSPEGFRIAWIDEAQTLSARSLSLLRPTIRAEHSELWASWNPRRRSDAIDDFFRTRKPEGAVVTKANWRDNPWFPAVFEEGRRLDLAHCPERYEHVWEGDYARAFEGAYFAQTLAEARAQGRIGKVSADPLLPLRAFIDFMTQRFQAPLVGSPYYKPNAHLSFVSKFIELNKLYSHYGR